MPQHGPELGVAVVALVLGTAVVDAWVVRPSALSVVVISPEPDPDPPEGVGVAAFSVVASLPDPDPDPDPPERVVAFVVVSVS